MRIFTEEHRKKISIAQKNRLKIKTNHPMYGKYHTEEAKLKMSKAHMGKITWNKGKHFSVELRRKISEGHKGQIAWNKGIPRNQMTKDKISNTRKGKFCGENHWNWQGGLTPLIRRIRHSFEYRQWRSDIFTRDDFTCQECGKRGVILNAHHIRSYSSIIQYYEITTLEEALQCEELWNINNGITLCKKCHMG